MFDAFADQTKKARWFGCVEGWEVAEHTIDFRVGGREVWRGGPPGGTQHRNDTVYHDIVPERAHRVELHDAASTIDRSPSRSRRSSCRPDGTGTRLRFVEQGVYLDDYDGAADRVRGTNDLLDSLDRALREER